MQLALYRAERPEVFEDIIGQKQIVRILKNQIKSGTVSQAYLFAGTHGTGKTSTARILAKALNCMNAEAAAGDEAAKIPCGECANCKAIKEGKFVDVIELDAASNNGVDDLRAIIDLVKYPPTIGKYKVFIIDEVHMLSPGAENAFLKTLEEPPEYAIFILATTDPQKVRATIRSRCMELNFKRVSEDELIQGMERICQRKGISITKDALATIAGKADGSVRDALSLLEQCMAAGDTNIDRSLVLEYIGSAGEEFYIGLTDAVYSGNISQALTDINDAIVDGKDSRILLSDWLEHYRELMITKYVDKAEKIINASEENIGRIRNQAKQIDIGHIEGAIRLISEYINEGRYSDRPRILLETAAVRLAGVDSVITSGAQTAPRPARAPRPATGATSAAQQAPRTATPAMGTQAAARPASQASATRPATEAASAAQAQRVANAEAQDAQTMWARIANEVAHIQPSFSSVVIPNSRARSFNGDELVVVIKRNKYAFAEIAADDVNRCAKSMFGSNIYVNMIAGDIDAMPSEPARMNRTSGASAETRANSQTEAQKNPQAETQSKHQSEAQAQTQAEAEAEVAVQTQTQAEAEAQVAIQTQTHDEEEAVFHEEIQADEPRRHNEWNSENDDDIAEELANDIGSMFGIEVSISDN